ncbi:MAG: DUF2190 family protein [Desulfomicrobium sp.]|nr:DUF2190 family protein [Pseudomonadota bacterium]MBV1710759.1 DUF2190 family protein [Desulfomicrobium sp.]MBU4570367.1 DUF2190 family protein [Pseudomonadota bacterium]MBU4593288.1 DUF2190 family protein [Pseudomonadota bacterium]MBV1719841.1 DUF2190 family protein [Desulfomicrobium sp.]
MSRNFVQEGTIIDYTPPATILGGAVAVIGSLVGVATTNIGAGTAGAVAVEGVFTLPADNTLTIAQGAQLYWDPVARKMTTVSVNNIPAGKAWATKLLAGTTVNVKLNA